MVPCHSYIFITFERIKGRGYFKDIIWGGNAIHKWGAIFMGKKGSFYVILLY